MKKTILVLTLSLLSLVNLQAQKLGDFIEIDGVPGVVIYVDNSGEHGLVMSLPAISTSVMEFQYQRLDGMYEEGDLKWTEDEFKTMQQWRDNKNNVMKLQTSTVEKSWMTMVGNAYDDIKKIGTSSKNPENFPPLTDAERKSIYKDLSTKIGNDGEANAKAIKEYCDEKGLSMKEKFPREYWATSLGDGWFVPGNDELELYAKFFIGGLEKGNKKKARDYRNLMETLTENNLINWACSVMADRNVFGLISSTFNDKGYYTLATKFFGSVWLEIEECEDADEECEKAVVAVHKF